MTDPSLKAQFEGTYRFVKVIHFVFVGTIFLYVALGIFLGNLGLMRPAFEDAPWQQIFYLLVASLVVIVLVMRKILLGPLEGVSAMALNAELLSRYRQGHLVVYAVIESIVLIGLVFRFLGAPLAHLLGAGAVALLLMILSPPKRLE